MKLKIKKTGEILEDVKFIDTTLHKITIQYLDNGVLRECSVKNLSDVEEVKDYEEPKVGYIIDPMEEDCVSADDSGYEEADIERAKELGIWLKSKEETEKAVEKLKAWKRLEDKGLEFDGVANDGHGMMYIKTNIHIEELYDLGIEKDLNALFGGEE